METGEPLPRAWPQGDLPRLLAAPCGTALCIGEKMWQLGGVLVSDGGFFPLGPCFKSVCTILSVSSSLSGQCPGPQL